MDKGENFFSGLRNRFFLRKHTLRPSTLQLLKDVFPTVDWTRVDFYEGLPWFTPIIAPYVTAQALPQFYSFGRFRIYHSKFDESRAQCLADIIHEGMHVFQAMHFLKGYGFGVLRGFSVHYTGMFVDHGYRNNPLEVRAYDQEFRFLAFCEKHHQHGIEPKFDPAILKYICEEKDVVQRHFEFHRETRRVGVVAGFIFCLLMTLLKPIADAFAFFVFLFRRK
jgi:hypothetical protein